MEKPCEFFKDLLFEDKKAIHVIVFLSSQQRTALKDHIAECSICQQTIREIRTTGPNLINFALDGHFGGDIGRT